jgi:hypothetical protein
MINKTITARNKIVEIIGAPELDWLGNTESDYNT